MATAKPNPAVFGNIASLLRSKMSEYNIEAVPLSKELGCSPSAIYFWINAQSAPGPEMRHKLSKLFDIPTSDLMPKGYTTLAPSESKALIVTAKKPSPVVVKSTHNPLVFTITPEGMANIKMDVTIPLETAQPLLRMLLDAGIVFSKPKGE